MFKVLQLKLVGIKTPFDMRAVAILLISLFWLGVTRAQTSCLDESGNPVTWFAQLKYPKTGEYLYADANSPSLQKSSYSVKSASDGALANTLNQIYNSDSLGYMMYNDEPPYASSKIAKFGQFSDSINNSVTIESTQHGHSKGVVGWDDSSGFWIVHSFPKFPDSSANGYSGVPDGELVYGQSVLCVSVGSNGLGLIGHQLQYNYPDIYDNNVPDSTPTSLADAANGKHLTSASTSKLDLQSSIPSLSKLDSSSLNVNPLNIMNSSNDAPVFTSFSKTGEWNKALYSELVAPGLSTDLLVETWIRGDRIPSLCPPGGFFVKNVATLHFPRANDFKETQDHSKWAISADASKPFVCIGGINQMTTQNVRGGGTVCQSNAQLWSSFHKVVASVEVVLGSLIVSGLLCYEIVPILLCPSSECRLCLYPHQSVKINLQQFSSTCSE